jgi:hypothetical protein
LANSFEIECQYPEPDFYWAVLGQIYTCDAHITSLATKPLIKVTGEHRRHKDNELVHGILIVHQRELEFFPQNLENFFPNLKAIDLEGCSITSISGDDLKPFESLEQLSLDDNKLTQLPVNLFANNLLLKRIDLEGNSIMHVALNIFQDLKELQTVFMRHNTCTEHLDRPMALRRDQVDVLEWELSIDCPQTKEMMIESILISSQFQNRLRNSNDQLDEVKLELQTEIRHLEKQIQLLKNKLA